MRVHNHRHPTFYLPTARDSGLDPTSRPGPRPGPAAPKRNKTKHTRFRDPASSNIASHGRGLTVYHGEISRNR